MKINTVLTKNQKKALKCMKAIALARDRLPYMRPLKHGEPGKKIFSEFVEGFVCEAFNLKQCKAVNQKGYDATSRGNLRFQIKDVTYSAPHLGDRLLFDYLITVKLNKYDLSVDEIGVYPRSIVRKNLGTKKDFRRRNRFPEYLYFKKGRWIKDK